MAKKVKYDLDDLLDLTKKYFPNRFKYAPEAKTRLSRLVYTAFAGTKILSVRGEVKGLSTNKTYKVILVFQGVDFAKEKDRKHKVPVDVGKGKKRYIKPLNAGHDIRIRCSCPDAYFTSLYYAWKSGNLYGRKPKKYVRKTTWWPERNPWHEPILCKHLISVLERVRKSKYYRAKG